MRNFDLQLLSGNIVIVAPHMDDEALACGGLVAKLPNKNRIHIIYATDGMKSPAPIMSGDEISSDLGKVRMNESVQAMKMLGVPEQNLHFLSLPEAQLRENFPALQKSLGEKLKQLAPQHIFAPFRYDRHLDHLAVNHVVVSAIKQGGLKSATHRILCLLSLAASAETRYPKIYQAAIFIHIGYFGCGES